MLAGALLAASLALTPAQSKSIDAAVAQVMTADHIPGLSIGVARKGAVLLLRGYGVRDRARGVPADGDTVYRIGSITKQFTAALVLQQIERGTLAFDTVTHGVTVQELLSQTSGLPTYTSGGATVEAALRSPPVFEPGTQFDYSNTNYYVLGMLLESATRAPYAALLQKDILDPLGLRATTLAAPSGANVATGYQWSGGAYVIARTDVEPDSSAGMSSSARDILSWLEALRTGRVVSDANVGAMTASQTLATGERTHYGYGFYIRDWYGWKTAEHPGYVDGFSADDALVLDDGLEIAVLANATNAYLLPLSKTIAQVLESPRDSALVADFSHAAQNENPAVTRDVTDIVHELQCGSIDRSRLTPSLNKALTPEHMLADRQLLSPFGDLTLVEFIDRTTANGATVEKYRLSFGYKQFWMTVGYATDGKVDTLTLQPDDD